MNAENETLKDLVAWNCEVRGSLPKVLYGASVARHRLAARGESTALARAGASAASIFKNGQFIPDDGAVVRSDEDKRPPPPVSEDEDGLPKHEVTITLERKGPDSDSCVVIRAYDVRAPDDTTAIALVSARLGRLLAKVEKVRFLAASSQQTAGPQQPRLPLGGGDAKEPRPDDVGDHGVVNEAAPPERQLASGGLSQVPARAKAPRAAAKKRGRRR